MTNTIYRLPAGFSTEPRVKINYTATNGRTYLLITIERLLNDTLSNLFQRGADVTLIS